MLVVGRESCVRVSTVPSVAGRAVVVVVGVLMVPVGKTERVFVAVAPGGGHSRLSISVRAPARIEESKQRSADKGMERRGW